MLLQGSWSKGSLESLGDFASAHCLLGSSWFPGFLLSLLSPVGQILQQFSQVTGNVVRIALPISLTLVLEHFCQKSCSPILSLERKNIHWTQVPVPQTKFSSWVGVPESMLIKINTDISSELIFEIKTISAKTDGNTQRPNQTSGIGKFCSYSKE